MTEIYLDDGSRHILGRELGRGGEGRVFEIQTLPNDVAKLYDEANAAQIEKLKAAIAVRTDRLSSACAWPRALLSVRPHGSASGFVMPKFAGYQELHEFYSPSQRKLRHPTIGFAFLTHVARNLAGTVHIVHQAGHCLGDFNQRNVLVNERALVRLIDCDSFQIRRGATLHRCLVGTEHMTPPELQGATFAHVDRTIDHDTFALAVLVFHTLMVGRHPFAGVPLAGGDLPIQRAIRDGLYVYGSSARQFGLGVPPQVPDVAILGELQRLFVAAFTSKARPSAQRWFDALDAFEKQMRRCTRDPGHQFVVGDTCPWCALGDKAVFYFVPKAFSGLASDWDLDALVRRVASMAVAEVTFDQVWAKVVAAPAVRAARSNAPMRPIARVVWRMLLVGACGSLVATVPGFWLLWLGLTVGLWGVETDAAKTARTAWEQSRNSVRAQLAALRRDWDARASTQALETGRAKFTELVQEFRALHQLFAKEHQALCARAEDLQRLVFLGRFDIASASIKGVGPTRKTTLESFSIETAADCTRLRIQAVPGFGPGLTDALLSWRDKCASKFRFDQSRGVPQADLDTLRVQQRQTQVKLQERITQEAQRLLAFPQSVNALRGEFARQAEDLASRSASLRLV